MFIALACRCCSIAAYCFALLETELVLGFEKSTGELKHKPLSFVCTRAWVSSRIAATVVLHWIALLDNLPTRCSTFYLHMLGPFASLRCLVSLPTRLFGVCCTDLHGA